MAHPFPAYLKMGYLHPATVTDDPFVPDGLKFTAVTFPFLGGSEYPFTKKAVLLGPKGPVIDGFRLFYFPVRPGPDHFRGGQFYHNGIKILYIPHILLLAVRE
jgi:hypothetical protein